MLLESLDEAFAAGRMAWPGITHDRTAFAAWASGGTIDAADLALRGAELYLASACMAVISGTTMPRRQPRRPIIGLNS